MASSPRISTIAFGLLALVSCQKPHIPPAEPAAPQATARAKAQPEKDSPVPAAPAAKLSLARMASLEPRVDLRRRDELVWRPAKTGERLERHDAVQTREVARARIVFRSGSELNLKENTLIVLDHDPEEREQAQAQKGDRVVFRDGKLVGTTPAELWLLTSGGLVRLQAEPGSKVPARAELTVREGERMVVRVDSGDGSIVNPNRTVSGAPERIPIARGVTVSLPAPKPAWAAAEPKAAVWEALAAAARMPTAVRQLEMKIMEPADGREESSSKTVVRGSLTGSGARVLVNGEEVQISQALGFEREVALEPGANVIVIQLIRPDGGVEFQRRTVLRKGP